MITLTEFADLIDQTLVITYYPNQNGRFCCKFEYGLVREGCLVSSNFANGTTPQRAMDNYARNISGKTLVFHDMSEEQRVEYHVPMLLVNGTGE
jgi:hypothetical protein